MSIKILSFFKFKIYSNSFQKYKLVIYYYASFNIFEIFHDSFSKLSVDNGVYAVTSTITHDDNVKRYCSIYSLSKEINSVI